MSLLFMMFPYGAEAKKVMKWPPDRESIQLDLVGLLTVIGMMNQHCRRIRHDDPLPNYYRLNGMLPSRFLPAPQAFLLPQRLTRLPPRPNITTIGVLSGNRAPTLNYFPELLLDLDSLPRFALREVAITRKPERKDDNISPRLIGPTNILTCLGTAMVIAMLVLAVVEADGMAIIAVCLMSITSTFTGLGAHWTVDLQRRLEKRVVPPGDVLIKTETGGFILVRCDESVARELFFGQDLCSYTFSENSFRLFAGCGTFTLMAAVICLANCSWMLQASIGGCYLLLNALFWIAAVLPRKWLWDLEMYSIKEKGLWTANSYTVALFNLVRRTGTTKWAEGTGVAPQTTAWQQWLKEANENRLDEKWDAGGRLTELVQVHSAQTLVPEPAERELKGSDGSSASSSDRRE
ncbi:hypothetical protein BDZ91DRAFT_764985 [Kalaharituber pfeilii]|nr:hypothetical protein BDZ91DRAFT_764985 [Kalaharituber pfeilii]